MGALGWVRKKRVAEREGGGRQEGEVGGEGGELEGELGGGGEDGVEGVGGVEGGDGAAGAREGEGGEAEDFVGAVADEDGVGGAAVELRDAFAEGVEERRGVEAEGGDVEGGEGAGDGGGGGVGVFVGVELDEVGAGELFAGRVRVEGGDGGAEERVHGGGVSSRILRGRPRIPRRSWNRRRIRSLRRPGGGGSLRRPSARRGRG